MPPPEVLTPTDLDNIKESLQQLDDADSLIEQAQRAGIEVAGFKDSSRNARDKLLRLKQAFFPGE